MFPNYSDGGINKKLDKIVFAVRTCPEIGHQEVYTFADIIRTQNDVMACTVGMPSVTPCST